MSEIIQYPKWLYHKTEDAKIVESAEEHKACGKEWQDKPFEVIPTEKVSEILHDVELESEIELEIPKKKSKGSK